jgi:predicted nucleotidyltransferase
MERKMKKSDLKIVEKFKDLVSQKVKVHELRVFGSRARGDAVAESDLDVLIVVNHLDHSIERYISDCAWESGFPDDIVVMPVAISIDAIKNRPIRESVFIRKIYHEGIAV